MTIYVGIDGSEGAAEAARWAVAEGELRSTAVTAVVAWDLLDQQAADPDAEFDAKYNDDDALAALESWLVAALGADVAKGVQRLAVNDLPWRALTSSASDGELLVVGARGNGGFLGLRLGSVSEKCLHYATCPVAVVHAGQASGSGRDGHIVVGIDGSDSAARALGWALDEGRSRHATVVAVSAWDGGAVAVSAYPGAMLDPTVFEQAATEVLSEVVDAADTSGVTVERRVVAGGPAGVILDAAEAAALAVVGSRGLGGLKSALLGSVSRQVVHHSPCPVVVVPPPDRESPT